MLSAAAVLFDVLSILRVITEVCLGECVHIMELCVWLTVASLVLTTTIKFPGVSLACTLSVLFFLWKTTASWAQTCLCPPVRWIWPRAPAGTGSVAELWSTSAPSPTLSETATGQPRSLLNPSRRRIFSGAGTHQNQWRWTDKLVLVHLFIAIVLFLFSIFSSLELFSFHTDLCRDSLLFLSSCFFLVNKEIY